MPRRQRISLARWKPIPSIFCLLYWKTKHDNFSWPFPSSLPSHPFASYTRDKSYKKLHSCHFSRNESSRKIFLRHHCRSCESLRGKKKKKKNKKGRGREERLSLSILDLYSEKPKMCGIKSNDLINEEKMEME